MPDTHRTVMAHSVRDIIGILEREPVKPDLIGQITAVQIMNRVSIAHLSIERALKFLVDSVGGCYERTHHLGDRFRELEEYDPGSAQSLKEVFDDAVQHFRFNSNATNLAHLTSLEAYFDLAGSNRAFEDLRYWELRQSLEDDLLRQIILPIHMEILHGVQQLLLGRQPIETVTTRVERAVKRAMEPAAQIAYTPGSTEERFVCSYIGWRQRFRTWSEALAKAVEKDYKIGDDLLVRAVSQAYGSLLESADPAVTYFAQTLDVLPRQSRETIPPVEWMGPEKERTGTVKTPSGESLGLIERRWDGLWNITPYQAGVVAVTERARSQTDARSYLAALLTRHASVKVGTEERTLRIVANEGRLFELNHDQIDRSSEGTPNPQRWTHKIVFWDGDHGISFDDRVSVTVRLKIDGPLVRILRGVVTRVNDHVVYVFGSEGIDVAPEGKE